MTEEQPFENRLDLAPLSEHMSRLKQEIGKKLVGQTELVELALAGILAGGHLLIEGVPGVAKTYTAKLIARVLNADFSRIQFTPDLMPADVTGTNIFNAKNNDFEFKKGPIFSNVVLIDEINRAPAKTQAALFECMEEYQVSIDGHSYPLDFPFIVLATQNPVEHEGTYKLPEAQLDRFIFKIDVDYPTIEEEIKILEGVSGQLITRDLSNVHPILNKKTLGMFRELVGKIHIEPHLIQYIVKLVESTRNHHDIFLGASPRASIGILNASKAIAAIRGRDFITPEDIRSVTYPVLSHRVVPTPEKEMEGIRSVAIVKDIIESVEVPR